MRLTAASLDYYYQLGFGAREVSGSAQERQRDLAAVVDNLVLEQPVVKQRDSFVAVRAVDEPARDERRESCLVRTAFGREAAPYDREGALGVGSRDGLRERNVSAQAMITRAVVNLRMDAKEGLARPQLERRAHFDVDGVVAAA